MESELNGNQALVAEPAETSPVLAFFSLAWQRKSLILLGLVVGLIGAVLMYFQSAPVYQSTVQVHVVKKKKPEGLAIGGVESPFSVYEDYLAEHLILIKSPVIVAEAVKMHNLHKLPSFEGMGDPTAAIRDGLTVNRAYKEVAGTSAGVSMSIFDLSYRGPAPEDCQKVLEAVVDSYFSYLDKKYQTVSKEILSQITEARNVLRNDLAKQHQEYLEFRKRAPLVWKGKSGTNVHQERLASIQNKLNDIVIRRTETKGELDAIESALKEGRDRSEIVSMINKGATNKTYANLDDRLFPLRLQEQKLLLDYGPDHPQIIAIRKEMETIRQLFTRSGEPNGLQAVNASGENATAGDDIVDAHRQFLKGNLTVFKELEQSLTRKFNDEKEEAQKLAAFEVEDEERVTQKDTTKKLLDAIIANLQQVNLAKDQGGYAANVISPPTAGWKVAPSLLSNLPVALFLGIVGGFGLAYLADATDRSFRTPEDIRRRLGMPVIGHIPVLKPGKEDVQRALATGLDPVLCTYYRPRSVDAESFRGVRTALYFSTDMGAKQVIQITSPNRGDGKSSLAANLAVSIAQSGKKIVLLDADFRRPRMHQIFNVPNEMGLASVMGGELDPAVVTKETAIPGLSVIPCGPIPPNPAELLTSPRFQEFLDVLRKQFDYVLIDTPPLLLVTDPAAVAPRVDGVLLMVRVSKHGRTAAVRARDMLADLGCHVLGVVVNGVGGDSGGYGYRHYRYGYAYGHGYDQGGYRYEREGYYSDRTAVRQEIPGSTSGTNGNGASGVTIQPRNQKVSKKNSKKGFFRWI